MKYVIGLDIGTSAVKGILANENEDIIKSAECAFTYSSPNPKEVIISADDFLSSCYNVLRTLSESLPKDGELIAVCEASASGNVLLLDENNSPITPIYNWQDARTTTETEEILGKELTEKVFDVVGWGCLDIMPLAILCWLKVHEPETLKSASFITMSTEYLNFKLCDKWGVSPSAGTPFHLIEQETGKYYKPYLDKLGIDESMLPPVLPIGTQIGTVTETASKETGLPVGTPILLGTFDHIAGGIGANVTKPGQMLLSCGTSWVFFLPTEKRETSIKAKLLTDPFLSSFGGSWCCMKSLPSIAHNINEYVHRYISADKDCFAKLDEYCLAAKSDANGLLIDPFVHPDNAPDLSGYDKTDIARAIMVGVSQKLKEALETLSDIGICANSIVMVGGPSRSKVWQSVIAEITERTVTPASGAFTGALGAAKIGFGLKL
ncbi:MAG: hypothetical protein IJB50_01345 [Clostridia bacterium]|nr:hypothetical protein [Clostridia bacterium]